MPTLHLLGTGAAQADPHRTTTMVAFADDRSTLAVDCGGDVVQRLQSGGVDLDSLRAMVLTHEHPDHVSGFPLFMEKIWLAGRRRPIPVYGPKSALDQARRIFEAFDTSGWKGMPEIEWHEVALEEGAEVLEDDRWKVTAAPGTHSVPVIGVRVEHRESGHVAAYSSDTERSDKIARLAKGAHVLVHEATGGFSGHSSAAQAAQVAQEAGAGRLLLVHLPPGIRDEDLAEARRSYEDAIDIGEEGGRYDY